MDTKQLLTLGIFLLTIALAQGLKCYVCDGDAAFGNAGDCGDPYDTSISEGALQECNSTEIFCRKQKKGANDVYTTVTRSCARNCEERNTLFVDRVVCCDSDGCNAASSLVISGAAILVTAVAAILRFRD